MTASCILPKSHNTSINSNVPGFWLFQWQRERQRDTRVHSVSRPLCEMIASSTLSRGQDNVVSCRARYNIVWLYARTSLLRSLLVYSLVNSSGDANFRKEARAKNTDTSSLHLSQEMNWLFWNFYEVPRRILWSRFNSAN